MATIPPNVWHEAICKSGGKMLSIFKNGKFHLYLEKLSKMSDRDFADSELINAVSKEFDIYQV